MVCISFGKLSQLSINSKGVDGACRVRRQLSGDRGVCQKATESGNWDHCLEGSKRRQEALNNTERNGQTESGHSLSWPPGMCRSLEMHTTRQFTPHAGPAGFAEAPLRLPQG